MTGADRQQQQQQQLDMWRNGYTIDPSRLPLFLGQKLASKILRAGKSINFLQVIAGLIGVPGNGESHWNAR
jgi:hypothetical protein